MANDFPELPFLDRSDSEHSSGSGGTAKLHNFQDESPNLPVRQVSSLVLKKKAVPTVEDLGYEAASPGKSTREDVEEEEEVGHKTHQYDHTKVPRRSSLKAGTGTTAPTMRLADRVNARRASMGCTATEVVEVRIRGERYPIQRRRSIDFNATVQVKEVVPVTEDASCSELWLQPDDFAKMKTERRAVVQKHKSTHQHHAAALGEDDDIRGLEKYLDRSGRILKNRAWDTVLLEQDEQELTGVFNDQRIADLYRSTTFTSPEKAAEQAKADQEAVREYLMSPRTTKLMMRRLSA